MDSKDIILDAETDGLSPTKVHCASYRTASAPPVTVTAPSALRQALNDHTGRVIGHNLIGFDKPALSSLWDVELPLERIKDTLVLSRLANPSRPGGHSMDNWGKILGVPKVEHTDFSRMTPELQVRCEEDTNLNLLMLNAIEKELKGFSKESIELEHEVQRVINKQINKGWLLDQRGCFVLINELEERKADLEDQVHERFLPKTVPVKKIIPKYKNNGSMSSVGLKFLGDDCLTVVGGEFTRIDTKEFNLGSRRQIGEYLIDFGWEPKRFTEKGQPIVDETILSAVEDIPEASLIAEYLTVVKRIAQVNSWLDAVDPEDGRVHGYVNPIGAVTGRMTHSGPNMAQVPANGKPYGLQCRSVWIVSEGYKLVGTDADGLELRMLAHYMNDPEYTKILLNGDIHTYNMEAAGLTERRQAKVFIYAFLYGAGDALIGAIVGGTAADGKRLKQKFLKNIPALKSLKERVDAAVQIGWLKGLDGRKIIVRNRHAALNTLLQGAGAVVMKKALVILDDFATKKNIDFGFVGNIHDEFQVEVKEEQASLFAKIAEISIKQAGEQLGLRCPLSGSSDIGNNWGETHG